MKELTQARLKELLHYDKISGLFSFKVTRGGHKPGTTAGAKHHSGYIDIKIDRKLYRAHRIAWLYVYGYMPKEIDHIDHAKSNNSIDNLRCVTRSENLRNATMRIVNTSGFTGVHWHKGNKKWQSKIWANGKRKHLGYYKTFYAACYARHAANIKYGYHANHGKGAVG